MALKLTIADFFVQYFIIVYIYQMECVYGTYSSGYHLEIFWPDLAGFWENFGGDPKAK